MEAKTVDEEELLLLISEPTNKNGFEILSKLKKGARNNHQFEQELRKIFPQSNSGNGNIMKAVDKFLKEYENKKNTTILRINRANAESIFANENGKVCKLCSEIKKTAKESKTGKPKAGETRKDPKGSIVKQVGRKTAPTGPANKTDQVTQQIINAGA